MIVKSKVKIALSSLSGQRSNQQSATNYDEKFFPHSKKSFNQTSILSNMKYKATDEVIIDRINGEFH
jgi:hypothetical protein